MMVSVEVGGRARRVDLRSADVLLDGRRLHVDAATLGDVTSLIVGQADPMPGAGPRGRCYEVAVVERAPGELVVHVNGRPITVSAPVVAGRRGVRAADRRDAGPIDGARPGPHRVVAPMPGRIAKVLVKVGDAVAARQGLVVVEAMKMENELRSPRAGRVADVPAREGARVEANAVLVVVE